MKIETFFEKFDHLADALNAVAKLRELVLHLAVQGKLVQQDPNDQPASELLRVIQAEKEQLVQYKGAKAPKPLPPITPDEEPYQLPQGWEWVRLGNIGDTNIGLTYSPEDISNEGIPVLRANNIQNGKLDLSEIVRVDVDPKESVLVREGDLLICARNGSRALVGKAALIEQLHERTAFGAFMAIFRSSLNKYLYHFVCSPLFRQVIAEVNTTTINQITQGNLRSTLAPIPPLAEQARIVAKVNELMAVCDRLEAQLQERNTRHAALARASIARFAEAPSPDNLNLLFHDSYTIESVDLSKAILALAVQGKLVQQDPNDEPASLFLDRNKLQRVDQQIAGRVRRPQEGMPIPEKDIPFVIPDTWSWVRLETLADKITDGEHLSPNKTMSGMPLLTATHITAKGVTMENPQYVAIEDGLKFRQRCDPRRGDVLICSRGTIGRCAVVETDEIFCLMGSVILVRLPAESTSKYFNYFLSTDLAQEEMRGMSGATAVQALYLKDLRQCLVPVPPLAEQRRIVAKVDQLMALVAQLEALLAAFRTTATSLRSAVIAELTAEA